MVEALKTIFTGFSATRFQQTLTIHLGLPGLPGFLPHHLIQLSTGGDQLTALLGTSLLERGWTFFYAGVVPGDRQRAGVDLLIAP